MAATRVVLMPCAVQMVTREAAGWVPKRRQGRASARPSPFCTPMVPPSTQRVRELALMARCCAPSPQQSRTLMAACRCVRAYTACSAPAMTVHTPENTAGTKELKRAPVTKAHCATVSIQTRPPNLCARLLAAGPPSARSLHQTPLPSRSALGLQYNAAPWNGISVVPRRFC